MNKGYQSIKEIMNAGYKHNLTTSQTLDKLHIAGIHCVPLSDIENYYQRQSITKAHHV